MTKKEAVEECKKLWEEIEDSGLTKYGFLHSPAGKKWKVKHYQGHCPLCEYAGSLILSSRGCLKCPLATQYGKKCDELGFSDSGHSLPSFFEAVKGLRA